MKTGRVVAILLAAQIAAAIGAIPTPASAQTSDRIASFAERLVTQVIHAKRGDVVEINASTQNLELAEDIWANLHQVGAWGIIWMHTPRMDQLWSHLTTKYDSDEAMSAFDVAHFTTADIQLDWEEDPAISVPLVSRFPAWAKGMQPVVDYQAAHAVDYVDVGNSLNPSRYVAPQFGISLARMSELFWSGLNVDPATIDREASGLRSDLHPGALVHVTAPNGTDFTYKATGPDMLSDGMPSAANHYSVSLPAGDDIIRAIPGTANGIIVSSVQYYLTTKVTGLTMHLSGGKLISWSAATGSAEVAKFYATAGAGRDAFTYADIGLNPAIHFVDGSSMTTTMLGGMVTLNVGRDNCCGGTNFSASSLDAIVPHATVTIDGTAVINSGDLAP
ncbi:MAG TPA: hypothetical protein VID24_13225 [Candidatus Eremiobacteraceae bacterium]|jgi:leucyl aminopeptidase (aminopeptidase T)